MGNGRNDRVTVTQIGWALKVRHSMRRPPPPPSPRRLVCDRVLSQPVGESVAHRVLACGTFQPESLPQRGLIQSRSERNVNPGNESHRIASKAGITPPTDDHGCNKNAFPCPGMSITGQLVSYAPNSHHFHSWFRTFCGQNFTFCKNHRKTKSHSPFWLSSVGY